MRPTVVDYSLLFAVGIMWGAQFALNDIAIESFGPLTVGAGRLVFGVLALSAIVAGVSVYSRSQQAEGEKSPARVIRQPWRLYTAIAVVEAIIPLVFIPWGQRTVDSAIAACLPWYRFSP
jgi:EamA-like transporter family